MQLTRTADYGVRVMTHLATIPEDTLVNVEKLAAATGASPAFLGKILQRLVTARLIASRRGHAGGFRLARAPSTITMLDVITAIEGPLCLNACLPGGAGCTRKAWCAALPVWIEAQAALARVLSSKSIDDLARTAVVKPRGARRKYVRGATEPARVATR